MKRLVLIGGGHSHVEVLRRFGLHPAAHTELVLVSPARCTSYSGMLPGLVAGHYDRGDSHIDLERVARFAGARFLQTPSRGIDAAQRRIMLADGTALEYDVASINVGSVPAVAGIPGAAEHAVSVKPTETFLRAWDALTARARAGDLGRLAVVGGGAAGVEMLLAMQFRLAPAAVRFLLVTDMRQILPNHGSPARAAFSRIFSERGVAVHTESRIARVEPDAIVTADGRRIEADAVIWATGAGAPPQLRDMDLALDAAGFIAVNKHLQSITRSEVFAAGDCASAREFSHPKSGVYAVRQGPLLAENLRRALTGKPLLSFTPQKIALALISAGNRYAIASWGGIACEGKWVWRWKDYIDRKFMARYGVDLRA